MNHLRPPIEPMEALSVASIPQGTQWAYEPKWDGFRCLVFREKDAVTLQSKSGKPLTRYFPEVAEAIRMLPKQSFVLDGELVVSHEGAFSFDDLLQRIHPAQSRVTRLAAQTPAELIVFDLLSADGKTLLDLPLRERRVALERFAKRGFPKGGSFHLSPQVRTVGSANAWLKGAGGDLDGVVAKRLDLPYLAGSRDGMQKIKLLRSADCVVGGFRYNEGKKVVGSLLLGLYDDAGLLNHVGFTSAIAQAQKKALTAKLEKLAGGSGFTGNAPGGPSRWSTKRSAIWTPLKPSLVVEVGYDHFTGGRFRHGTQLIRWRPDKAPKQCRMDQVQQRKAKAAVLLSREAARD